MSAWDWVLIIAKILELIANGMNKDLAVKKTSKTFGVDVEEVWKHGGF